MKERTVLKKCLIFMVSTLYAVDARSSVNMMLSACDRKWEMIYSNDQMGMTQFGSKRELIEAAMSGSYIKVSLYMPDHIFMLPADNLYKRDDQLCMQSLRTLATNGSQVDTTEPWLYFMVCTTGHVTELDVFNSSVFRVAMNWYVKDISSNIKPIYSNFHDGCPVQESNLARLHEAAKRMNLFLAMRDKPYVFPLHNVYYDSEVGEVGGQNLLHLGQRFTDNFITFHELPYKWFSYWSNTGHRDNARWSLQKHQAYKHNSDTSAVDWYADVCWRHIYTNDESGLAVYGRIDDLLDAISKGHRVRVRFDDMAMEVSNLRVKNRVVAAQLLSQITMVSDPDGHRLIENDTRVRICVAHTTGKVHYYDYLVGNSDRKIRPSVKKTIEWMIDTRSWTIVLQTVDPPGEPTFNSVMDLQSAVMEGASIRLKVEQDPLAGSFYTQANNIRVDLQTDTVYVQALDHLSDVKSKVPDEYELQKSAFHWYLLISSKGTLRMTAWMFGSDAFRYEEAAKEATITWFVNL